MVKKYNFEQIKDYLHLEHPLMMKALFWNIILILNIVGLPTVLVGDPGIMIKAMFIPIVLINICNIMVRINMEKYQLFYLLLKGAFCLVLSILCIMAGYRFFIMYYKEYDLIFIFLTMMIYMLILCGGFVYLRNALREGCFSSKYKNKSKASKFVPAIIVASSFGLVIGKVAVGNLKSQQNLITLILSIILVIIGFAFALGLHYFYKYNLIKQYRPELFQK